MEPWEMRDLGRAISTLIEAQSLLKQGAIDDADRRIDTAIKILNFIVYMNIELLIRRQASRSL